jgi:cystathionine gamma-lyase
MVSIRCMSLIGGEDSHAVVRDDVYGGTRRLFDQVRRQSESIETTYADLNDVEALTAAIAPNTRLVWLETPTNQC